jgi:hypothetical protein
MIHCKALPNTPGAARFTVFEAVSNDLGPILAGVLRTLASMKRLERSLGRSVPGRRAAIGRRLGATLFARRGYCANPSKLMPRVRLCAVADVTHVDCLGRVELRPLSRGACRRPLSLLSEIVQLIRSAVRMTIDSTMNNQKVGFPAGWRVWLNALACRLRAPLGFALACVAVCAMSGCVSSKYKFAGKETPPARTLSVHFPPAPLDANLASVITYGGPGSWKREAFWDEYVVELHNTGDQPLEIASATLVDFAGTSRSAGDDPWALERESKTLEKKYRDAGIAFARVAAPRVLVTTAEPVVVSSVGIGAAGAAAAATATAVALPVYGLATLGRNRHSKAAVKAEFNRRRLPLPLSLAPGETRTGSLFFPMVPNPRSLNLDWSNESGKRDSALTLDFLHGLHVTAASGDATTQKTSSP